MGLLPCAPMRISDFNFDLPDELIARYPTAERRGSRLLEVDAEINAPVFSKACAEALLKNLGR